jgi:hypothetical protein
MRHFTVDEANALIPSLAPVLDGLHDVYIDLQEAVAVVQEFEARALQNGHATDTRIFEPDVDVDRIRALIAERIEYLTTIGVVLKDIQIGLIDFPAHRDDRDVYLCWHLGEESVEYWHELDEGYRNRKPIR